jgi:hypothetical protein
LAFVSATKRLMASCRSTTDRNTPRWRRWRVSSQGHPCINFGGALSGEAQGAPLCGGYFSRSAGSKIWCAQKPAKHRHFFAVATPRLVRCGSSSSSCPCASTVGDVGSGSTTFDLVARNGDPYAHSHAAFDGGAASRCRSASGAILSIVYEALDDADSQMIGLS